MVDYKQIVYREEDKALVIVPQNDSIGTKVVFIEQLEVDLINPLLALKTLSESKVDSTLKYVVAYKGTNELNIEHKNGVLILDITKLPNDEILIITNAITACLQILNS
jgi:hypothetical protein